MLNFYFYVKQLTYVEAGLGISLVQIKKKKK